MKKLIIALVLVMAFTGIVGAADFRDVNWGMSRAEVAGREGGQPLFEEEYLMAYETEIFGAEFAVGYLFYEDKLTDARYMLMDSDVEGIEYKTLIEDLNDALTKKYDGNSGEGFIWFEDTYRYQPNDFDLAVSVGDVAVRYFYEGPNTDILLGVMGGSYNDEFFIFYEAKDPELVALKKQRKEEAKAKSESQL
jgi:hypothetical protein